MRYAFIFMFLLNATFFSWQYYTSETEEPVQTVVEVKNDDRYDTITLLHEAGKFVPDEHKVKSSDVTSISDRIGLATEEKQEIIKNEVIKCYRLGPFKDEKDVEDALRRTRNKGGIANITTEDKKERFRYWVLDNTGSFSAAKRKLKKYRGKGVKDVFLIKDGKKKDNISLGIFRARATAQRRLEKLKKLGFSPVVEKHYKIRTQYWLNIGETLSSPISENAWGVITRGFEGVTRSDRVC